MEGEFEENVCSSPRLVESQNIKITESAENFQKFMYNFLETNGVLNDLRSYLRGHIVEVLRSTRTGDPLPCQKHFTQRLELPFQALNIMLVEYLLRLEFSYSLSVFTTEIPLANMVFAFAKSFMEGSCGNDLRFKDEDIYCILHFLGIKCDSEHATNVVKMYRSEENSPLLLCMLKCMPMFKEPSKIDLSRGGSLSSGVNSSNFLGDKAESYPTTSTQDKCEHSAICKVCQAKMLSIKEKYRNKKTDLIQESRASITKPLNVKSLMKNIGVMEKNFIDEMFQELKSVYEAEVEMIKSEEEKRVKKSLATLAISLKKKRIEMEEKFKAREMELEQNVEQKKRFLWGLARLLREQHAQMSRAMQSLRAETDRLSVKETSFKTQLAEVEKVFRQRGEDMRLQISNELTILEGHLETMKKERETIKKERSELERMKNLCESGAKTTNLETKKNDFQSHYDLLKEEFRVLTKYIETANVEPKCVIERSTVTELPATSTFDEALNNEQDVGRSSTENKVKPQRVVNDLKKQKVVNFNTSNLDEMYLHRSRSSRSTGSSEAGDCDGEKCSLRWLKEENERLRNFARQQGSHIEELSSEQARLRAAVAEVAAARPPPAPRPRTAPAAPAHRALLLQQVNPNASTNNLCHGWRKGAGEELSFFSNANPRIIVPGDTLPFIGVLRDRHNDNRRYLFNQWRSLRCRVSPAGAVGKLRTTGIVVRERTNSAGVHLRNTSEEDLNNNENVKPPEELPCRSDRKECERRPKTSDDSMKNREKSPKSMLREAKEKLKSKDTRRPPVERERGQSPKTILRDAKRRLRKLEIEAEAVEKSYLNFKRRREEMKDVRWNTAKNDNAGTAGTKEIDSTHDQPQLCKADEALTKKPSSCNIPPQTTYYSKYVEEYHTKYDMTHFTNKNITSVKVKPIPPALSTNEETHVMDNDRNQNYLDTPMAEFRKYYHSEKRVVDEAALENRPSTSVTKYDNFEINRFGSPKFVNFKTLPKPSVTRNEVNSKSKPLSPLPLNTNTIAERIGSKSPVAKNKDKIGPKSPISPRASVPSRPITPVSNNIEEYSYDSDNKKARTKTLKQLETINQDIVRFSNPLENGVTENNESVKESIKKAKQKIENERKAIIDDIMIEGSRNETSKDDDDRNGDDNKNLLRIELQSVGQVNDVKVTESYTQDLLFIFEKQITNPDELSDPKIHKGVAQSTQVTIIVSPTKSSTGDSNDIETAKSQAKHREAGKNVTLIEDDVMNAIYEADTIENISSIHMQIELPKEIAGNTLEADDPKDVDDYSVDINNLHYETDFDNQSSISLPKTSEEDNFWVS